MDSLAFLSCHFPSQCEESAATRHASAYLCHRRRSMRSDAGFNIPTKFCYYPPDARSDGNKKRLKHCA